MCYNCLNLIVLFKCMYYLFIYKIIKENMYPLDNVIENNYE